MPNMPPDPYEPSAPQAGTFTPNGLAALSSENAAPSMPRASTYGPNGLEPITAANAAPRTPAAGAAANQRGRRPERSVRDPSPILTKPSPSVAQQTGMQKRAATGPIFTPRPGGFPMSVDPRSGARSIPVFGGGSQRQTQSFAGAGAGDQPGQAQQPQFSRFAEAYLDSMAQRSGGRASSISVGALGQVSNFTAAQGYGGGANAPASPAFTPQFSPMANSLMDQLGAPSHAGPGGFTTDPRAGGGRGIPMFAAQNQRAQSIGFDQLFGLGEHEESSQGGY